MVKRVKILGETYKVDTNCKELVGSGADGMCKMYSKEIKIIPAEFMLENEDKLEEKIERYKEVVRHEVIHAFLSENGLDDYSRDEKIVQWFAMQLPKINMAISEVLK